jgi:general secretion pathway protein A
LTKVPLSAKYATPKKGQTTRQYAKTACDRGTQVVEGIRAELYQEYWGLTEKPFENTPDPRFLYQSADGAEVFARLFYAMESNRGAAMLTGATGCGKTIMARALVQEFEADRLEVAFVTTPARNADEFLRELLYENYSANKITLVLIEEGHLLPDQEILEEIRLLLNFQLDDAFLVTLLLVGQNAMAQRLAEFPALDQRIAARGTLKPLTVAEVNEYVGHRLRIAGREEPVFTEGAVQLIHRYSGGVPRKINNICDISLVIGSSRKLQSIDPDWMERLIRAESSYA